jgi:hypothetical protein
MNHRVVNRRVMSPRVAALAACVLLAVTACADPRRAGPASPGGSTDAAGDFDARARRIAQVWRDAVGKQDAWRTGFVPLQDLTVAPPDVTFDDGTKQAFSAGWYTLDVGMPREAAGRTGTITYPDGSTATVPLVPLVQAYGQLDQGDPMCVDPEIPPPPDAPAGGPDSAVSDTPSRSCTALTVTRITLGSVALRTSRGVARVPAWLFRIRELDAVVARVAVAESAIVTVPQISPEGLPPVQGLVAAQDIGAVNGATLPYQLGVGACDENITPVWYEAPDVVVVAGTVVTRPGVCTDQLLLHPVTATLDADLGARPVLDGVNGQVLTQRTP